MKILIINGVNMNMLGVREPEKYGNVTLRELEKSLYSYSFELGVDIETFQSNHEGEIVEKIHSALNNVDGIVINPAAYTHTSVAIRDALLGTAIPFFEIHISNVHAREEFRHHSYLSDKAVGVIVGFGLDGYEFALRKAARLVNK